ncbi:MAG: DUF5804 family protein [Salinarchaeum sp.]
MTEVALIGTDDVDLRSALLTSETAGAALATYDLREPFANAIGLDTVSLGSAVALLNDLEWHLKRVTDLALVREPSINTDEWLSAALARAVRNETCTPEETGEYVKIYGIDGPAPGRPVEPLYARRTDDTLPTYDLRDVEETIVVRVTADEFE